jgi:hypothetical protein
MKAYLKLSTKKFGCIRKPTKYSSKALITNMNRPSVKMRSGNAINIKTGRTKAFRMPSNNDATIRSVLLPQ